METMQSHLEAIQQRMRAEALPELAIQSFTYYYNQLIEGDNGMVPEEAIHPVEALPDLEALDEKYVAYGKDKLKQTVMLKLNGGLGTGMGLQQAKSLLPIRGELTFLDVIAKQTMYWDIPLVLMNSYSTAEDSLKKLSGYPELDKGVPLDFLQHKVPKIEQETLAPARWAADSSLEWCPPGHGDIYTALLTTGMLDQLLSHDIRYVFVSNSDNLGAKIDLGLLGYFSKHELPFMMEVADRTPADRKGGHLALKKEGGFLLRESAQCLEQDEEAFQDITRHRYFNTNNLWIDLKALQAKLEARKGILGLPMIRNAKTVDPRDPLSPKVFQIETAMGAAIGVFEDAGAIRVPRTRFAPVKTTNELLAVQSDAYKLQDDFSVVLHYDRAEQPCIIDLEKKHYKTVDALAERFPEGPPSLLNCKSLIVRGDVQFGKNIKCIGEVEVVNKTNRQVPIEAGTVLEGWVIIE